MEITELRRIALELALGQNAVSSPKEVLTRAEEYFSFMANRTVKHYSDCPVNNMPAYPVGECDCAGR